VAEWLVANGFKLCPCNQKICPAIKNSQCIICNSKIIFNLTIFNKLVDKNETIEIDASILDTEFDLIIGRPTIIKHKLLEPYTNVLYTSTVNEGSAKVLPMVLSTMLATQPLKTVSPKVVHKNEILDYEEDNDQIKQFDDELPWEKETSLKDDDSIENNLPNIFGNENEKELIKSLCIKYNDIFSR
jgi:hypothetical protein